MRLRARIYIINVALMGLLLLSGCEEPAEKVAVDYTVHFVLPANEVVSSRVQRDPAIDVPARVMGDPGTKEFFAKPTHAYVFVVSSSATETIIYTSVATNLSSSDWVLKSVEGDPCYVYDHKITITETPGFGDRNEARIYAVMSSQDLRLTYKNKLDADIEILENNSSTWPSAANTTEDRLKEMVFDVNDGLQDYLQDIYSSPCDYKPDGVHYYGEVMNIHTNAPSLNLMLYHVAAKVDLMWNVPVDKQNDLRVTGVSVKNLFEGDAYLFKPTKTQHVKFTDGYTPDAAIAGNSPGTWWTGRNYFYTMAYQATDNKFPLQVEIEVQDMKTGGNPKKTFDMTLRKGGLDVFTPWMRGQFTITRMPESDVESIDKEI